MVTARMAQAFRSDIEGLRALAVVPILLFHLNTAWCPGGFIGVDIFFVISGYLITRLILADGVQFSFRDFYIRRFFRLFPALLVTLAGTLVAAWWVLGPAAYTALAKSALSAVPGVSNIYFWATVDYFDAGALDHPLLHTWSLGVEEQFYLVWPALLLLVHRLMPRLRLLAVAMGAVSLAVVVLVRPWHPEATFYMMPFRMFEFAIGAAVLALETHMRPERQRFHGVVGILALGVLGACLASFSGQMAWPGIAALSPSLATAALILVGGGGICNRLLSLAPLRFLGRISYSLYLVHWPVITLYRVHAITEPGTGALLQLGLVTIVLGAALHFCVERPFRQMRPAAVGKADPWRRLKAAGLATTTIIFIAGSAGVLWTAGFPSRLDRQRVQFVDKGLTFAGDICSFKRAECVFGDLASNHIVYVIGDSHALNLIHGLDRLFAASGIKGIALYDHGCLFALDTRTFVKGVVDQKCARNVAQAYDYLSGRAEPVIIAMDYTSYRGAVAEPGAKSPVTPPEAEYFDWLRQRFEAGLAKLDAGNRPVAIIRQSYNTVLDLAKCLSRPGRAEENAAEDCKVATRAEAFAQYATADRMIDRATIHFPSVLKIDPKQVFCANETCITRDAAALYFRDTTHLTNEGSVFLIERIKVELLAKVGRRR